MTTVTDVIAVEKEHVLQVYRRGSVVFDRGRGCRLFDTNGRSYLDLISGVGVASLGHAHPATGRRDRRPGAASGAYVEPVLPSAAGRAGLASRRVVRPAARVLLQQRRGGGRGDAEVRPPLLVRRRAHRAAGSSRFDRSFHGRTMGAVSVRGTTITAHPFSRWCPTSPSCPRTTCGR